MAAVASRRRWFGLVGEPGHGAKPELKLNYSVVLAPFYRAELLPQARFRALDAGAANTAHAGRHRLPWALRRVVESFDQLLGLRLIHAEASHLRA